MRRRYSESELDNKKEACRKRVSPSGTRLPDNISEGTICTDITGKKWRIGRSAGVGGFGEIYLVSDDTSKPVGEDAHHVIKVEPHHSGPLFVERNFYVRVAKQEMIDKWKQDRGLSHLGISPYVASGSHSHRGKLYRFLVLERFGSDLGKLFKSSGQRFHLKTALYIALQILDTLEYIHDKGYCHADIKDSNILLGRRRGTEHRVFLLDYGLASVLYNEHGKHKEYGPDERRAHAGTIEFVSRDGHQGACSRRGDLETLGYNLLQWLCGRLPWTDDASPAKPDYVYLQKKWFMSNISMWIKRCYCDGEPPGALIQYFKYVTGLSFESKPNYAYCKMIFRQGIKDACFVDDGKLVFGLSPSVKTTKKFCGKRRILEEPENLENGIPLKMSKVCLTLNVFRKPCVPHNINRLTRNSPGSQVLLRSQQFSWTKVLSGDPEKILFPEKKARRGGHVRQLELPGTMFPHSRLAGKVRERVLPAPGDEAEERGGRDGPPRCAAYTPAMLHVVMRKKLSKMAVVPAARRQRSDSSYSSSSSEVPACFQGYNHAMMEVARKMQKRKQAEAREALACSRRVCKASPKARARASPSPSPKASRAKRSPRAALKTKTVAKRKEACAALKTSARAAKIRALKQAQLKAQAKARSLHTTRVLRSSVVAARGARGTLRDLD
ncbi:serine/threonine-protein kinase VRK1-like [Bacillus rossius redtenbacheri]|uniref:serine/threonine-protein kinase VRK1-like n=1 Tax=Bacillus rossius redtenbacheri TaxID=93214 RepID=UPI002FDDEFC1